MIYVQDPDLVIHHGDCLDVLRDLEPRSVNCCVTSPPYWGLRDYGSDRQIGLEDSPAEFVSSLLGIFREVRRVLTDDGTLWLNLGDTYAAARSYQVRDSKASDVGNALSMRVPDGLKAKDLIGIPWRVAFALQEDGWYLRSDIIWSKPNVMPESITDRPTKAHEYVFMFSKSPRYYFDQEAVREPAEWSRWGKQTNAKYEGTKTATGWMRDASKEELQAKAENGRNIRSVWEIPTQSYAEAHFATFPEELPRRCIIAGCPKGGTVLDPFGGSGTTGLVARNNERKAILIELNEDYCEIAARRLQQLSLLA